MNKKILKYSERGQAIILIALAIVGMIGMVGLMTDGGILLVEYARLKRGIDAASVASALQFRKNYNPDDLTKAAEEFLRLNQSDVNDVHIDTCESLPLDAELCTVPKRKLVRVTASRVVTFGFMRVLGFNSTTISAAAIGEAASIDLVLVMDTSSSMAYQSKSGGNDDLPDPGPEEDPAICNASHTCQPLEDVKADAIAFIDKAMFFPYDRVSIVTLTSQNTAGFRDSATTLELKDGDVRNVVAAAINNIKVYEPPHCDSEYGVCRNLCDQPEIDVAFGDNNGDGDNTDPGDSPDPDHPCWNKPVDYFLGLECPVFRNPNILNPTSCGSSNIGGALARAQGEFAREPNREESLWIVVTLVGGPANSTNGTGVLVPKDAYGYPVDSHAFGYCPSSTWNSADPLCRGADVSAATRHVSADPLYDPDDYARDAADKLAGPAPGGAGVTIFTIGLGRQVQHAPKGDPLAGEKLLDYIATEAGDNPLLHIVANHGEYHHVEVVGGPELQAIFDAIAKNIFTRISK